MYLDVCNYYINAMHLIPRIIRYIFKFDTNINYKNEIYFKIR